jgi:ketosteroid isomerase-like protein
MTQANVQLVQVLFGAWNAGDMDAFREGYDPDAIMRAVEGWPEPGPWVGREAIMRQWKHMREAWDADKVEAVGDIIGIGDRVAVRYIWHGRGHGPESRLEFTTVCTVRKRKIVYQEFFWDHADALEAVGLAEQDAHADS